MPEFTLVTGACGGLGSAFVRLLAERGEALFLTGRSETRLTALKKELLAAFPALTVEVCACDLTDEASRAALFAFADDRKMRFARLVYVAGVDTQKALEKYTAQKVVLQSRVNLEAACDLACGVFVRRGDFPEFLAVGSMSASTPMPYFALYSATKTGLEQLFVALHGEWKGRAKVTVVLPGGIPTREDIKENIRAHGWFGRVSALSPRTVAERSLRALARNRRKTVIGGWNKLLYALTRCVPTGIRLSFVSRMWSKTEKDAF